MTIGALTARRRYQSSSNCSIALIPLKASHDAPLSAALAPASGANASVTAARDGAEGGATLPATGMAADAIGLAPIGIVCPVRY